MREIICEKELCTLGRKVSYKSHSGIIRAESRYFCSPGLGGGAHSRLCQNLPGAVGLKLNGKKSGKTMVYVCGLQNLWVRLALGGKESDRIISRCFTCIILCLAAMQ